MSPRIKRAPFFSTQRVLLQSLQKPTYRCFSCSLRLGQQQAPQNERTTHFGFEEVPESAKQGRVGAVFSSVATSYDTMNDLMSLYVHRLWKDHFVRSLNPGSSAQPQKILDVAGGTGDIAFRILDYATNINGDSQSKVVISDINPQMLAEGKKRSLQTPYAQSDRLGWLEANAEAFGEEKVATNSVDLYTVAFGIRNFTDKARALREAYRVLKPGGVFACLEFAKVGNPLLNGLYKRWSFGAIPMIGHLVAGDRDSYQYLVESIEKFPSQEEFRSMVEAAGFLTPGGNGWDDLMGGIAAIHRGVKPLK